MTIRTRLFSLAALSVCLLVLGASGALAQHGRTGVCEDGTPGLGLQGITQGPDHNLWFLEKCADTVGRITPAGTVMLFPMRSHGAWAQDIAPGRDGSLWFTEPNLGIIGRVSTTGQMREYRLPTQDGEPAGLVAGPDGAMWVSEMAIHTVDRITPAGRITPFKLPVGSSAALLHITRAADGNFWLTDNYLNRLARLTPTGKLDRQQTVPRAYRNEDLGDIIAGANSTIWVTRPLSHLIEQFSVANLRLVSNITTAHAPARLALGPDGAVWYTTTEAPVIGRIGANGTAVEYPLRLDGSHPVALTAGPDGAVWFTLYATPRIGRITPAGAVKLFSVQRADQK